MNVRVAGALSAAREGARYAPGALPRTRSRRSRRNLLAGLAFIAPALVLFALFVAYPVVDTIRLSLYDWDGVSPDKLFVGLGNFRELLESDLYFPRAVWNTLVWTGVTVPVQTLVGLSLALVLDRQLRRRVWYRSVFFLPGVMSALVVSFAWGWIYNPEIGVVNGFLRAVGLPGQQWLAEPSKALWASMALSVWRYSGFWMVFYLAGLQLIPPTLYEAARVDGASGWMQLRRITLPLLMPMTALIGLLGLINALREFEVVYLLTRGGACARDRPPLDSGVPAGVRPLPTGLCGCDRRLHARDDRRQLDRRAVDARACAQIGRGMTTAAGNRRVSLHAILTLGAGLWMLPLLIVVSGAVHVQGRGEPFSLVPRSFTFDNLVEIWQGTLLWRYFLNSLLVSMAATVIVLVISSLAAYGFTQHRFPGSGVLLFVLLSGIMLTPAVVIVPLYVTIKNLGLLNNYLGLIGPYSAFGLGLGVLLFRNSFLAVPRELAEAARVDGASPLRIYLKIFIPLSRPVIATVAILQFLFSWNDYILAVLVMTKEEMQTVQLAPIAFATQYLQGQDKQFAVLTLVMLPVILVFLVFQREFIRGLTGGAVNK